MESNGQPGKILMSEYSVKLLDTYFPFEFEFTPNTEVDIKNFNKSVMTFFVTLK